MKGVNRLVLNEAQMVAILQAWWDSKTYSEKDTVTGVEYSSIEKEFTVLLEEQVKTEGEE